MPIRGDSFEMLPEGSATKGLIGPNPGDPDWHSGWMSQHLRIQSLEAELRTLCAIKEQVDDVLIIDWITAKDNNYRQALADLVSWNIQIHDDPAVSEIAARRQKIEKLVEAADYLQHCRRREIQAHQFGRSDSAKKSVERASEQYDFLRGRVKL
jgi:hypothetical protein